VKPVAEETGERMADRGWKVETNLKTSNSERPTFNIQ
jgi:hypothetical protein